MTIVKAFPKIDYTSRDYASLRQSMLDNIADATGSSAGSFTDWTAAQDPNPNDFGIALIEAFAYQGDILSYYTDRLALESFLQTATLRSSVLNIAAMLDYQPIDAQPATVDITFTVAPGEGTITIPAGTPVSTPDGQPDVCPVVTFETTATINIQQNPSTTATGTVLAIQGITVTGEDAGTSDGSASQSYALLQGSVLSGSLMVWVDQGQGAQLWAEIDHLIDAGPLDTVYTSSTDSIGQTTITFGDGVTGLIPAPGSIITVTYRTGGGTLGNVGSGTVTDLINNIDGVIPPVLSGTASGGVDAESLDSIRVNAPLALTTLKRCVSLADYGNVALGIKQVAKAQAVGLVYTNVVLYACDYSGALDLGLKQSIQDYLVDKTPPGAHVTVIPPIISGIEINVNIMVNSRFNQSLVVNNAKQTLYGIYSIPNVTFGQSVYVSDIYAILAQIPGIDSSLVTVLTRNVNPTTDLGVTAVPGELLVIEADQITINPSGGIVAP